MSYRAPLYTLPTGITFDPVLGFVGTAVDTTYSEPATTVTLTDQGSAAANTTALQNAINTAAAASTGGTTIVIPAGVTYNGITLRARSGDGGWIYLVSSARASLPTPQAGNVPGDATHRVGVSDAANMWKIVNVAGAGKAIGVEAAAHHYRICGLDATTDPGFACFNLVFLTLEYPGMNTEANFPHHIGLDRCYLHGSTARLDMNRAVWLDADYGFVVGCHISDVMHSGADAQGVLMTSAHGPYKVCNNYIEATGENIMMGGSDALVAGLVQADIEIRANYGFKPLSWNPWHPSYDGIHRDIKNTWEIKNAKRVLFEGNIAENDWFGDGAQYYVVNFKTTNQGGSATWVETKDVTFCYNKCLNVFGGFSVAGSPEAYPVGAKTNRLDIYDNLIVHGEPNTLGDGYAIASLAINGMGPSFAFRHNTFVGPQSQAVFFTSATSADVTIENNVFRRMTTWPNGGVKGDGTFSPAAPNDGDAVFTAYCTTHSFTANGFYDAAGGSAANRASYTTPGNALLDGLEADIFTNSANGNYRLAPGVFTGLATDTNPIGANIDLIDTAVLGGLTPPPQAGFTFTSTADGVGGSTATQLLLTTQPAGAVSGVALTQQPVVRIADAGGSTVTSDTSTVTASVQTGPGVTITAGSTAVASSGVATFAGLTLSAAATTTGVVLRFSDGALTTVDSSPFTLTVPDVVVPGRTYPSLIVADTPSVTRAQWRRRLRQWRQLAAGLPEEDS